MIINVNGSMLNSLHIVSIEGISECKTFTDLATDAEMVRSKISIKYCLSNGNFVQEIVEKNELTISENFDILIYEEQQEFIAEDIAKRVAEEIFNTKIKKINIQ